LRPALVGFQAIARRGATQRSIAFIAEGMPLSDGDSRHVYTIPTDTYKWFAMFKQEAQR